MSLNENDYYWTKKVVIELKLNCYRTKRFVIELKINIQMFKEPKLKFYWSTSIWKTGEVSFQLTRKEIDPLPQTLIFLFL